MTDGTGISDAGNMQLIAGRFTSTLNFRNDPAILGTRVLDSHYQHLMPSSFSAASIVGNYMERSSLTFFERTDHLSQSDEIGGVVVIPVGRPDVDFTRQINFLISTVAAISKLALANFPFGHIDGQALCVRKLRLLGSANMPETKQQQKNERTAQAIEQLICR